jgi:hypothetical protein
MPAQKRTTRLRPWYSKGIGHVPLLRRAAARGSARVETLVGGNPIQPGAKRRAFLEATEALPYGQQRVLERVLGVLEGSEHPVAVHLQLPPIRVGESTERVASTGSHKKPMRLMDSRTLGDGLAYLVYEFDRGA